MTKQANIGQTEKRHSQQMQISTACGILKQCVRSKQKAPGVETRKDDQGFFFGTLQPREKLFNQ